MLPQNSFLAFQHGIRNLRKHFRFQDLHNPLTHNPREKLEDLTKSHNVHSDSGIKQNLLYQECIYNDGENIAYAVSFCLYKV